MKTIKIFLTVALLSFFYCGVNTNAATDNGSKSKSFNVGEGGKLTVDISAGAIRISTWSKNQVEIRVSGLDEEDLDKIEMTSDNKNVSVLYDESWGGDGDAEFEITVPNKYNLDLKTSAGDIKLMNDLDGYVKAATNGGDVSFKNVSGELDAESNGGNISVSDIGGNLNLNTMGGDISVGVAKGKDNKVNTMGGEISITKSVSGISAKTYGGDITMGDAGGESEFVTYGGNISVGNIKGNVTLETYGGNLELKSAVGKVKGKTNGGNITLGSVQGSVDVRTLAGEVSVVLNPSPNSESRISTNAGSIELKVPSSAKTEIEARVRVQGWWKEAKDEYKINSDFNAESYKADNSSHEIVGKYVINGGGSKIYLKSVNDEISIKKETK